MIYEYELAQVQIWKEPGVFTDEYLALVRRTWDRPPPEMSERTKRAIEIGQIYFSERY